MKLDAWLELNDVTQGAFAADLAVRRGTGCSEGLVWQWLHGRTRIAGEWVLHIVAATRGEVSAHELRPDLYPKSLVA